MDPLSVAASVTGLLAAAGAVSATLRTFTQQVRDAPALARHVLYEVTGVSTALSQLREYLAGDMVVLPARASMIMVETVLCTLTAAVTTFADLEGALDATLGRRVAVPGGKATVDAKDGPEMRKIDRVRWSLQQPKISRLLKQVQTHKASMSLMLNILQCRSMHDAESALDSLGDLVSKLLRSNQILAARMRTVEIAVGAGKFYKPTAGTHLDLKDASEVALDRREAQKTLISAQETEIDVLHDTSSSGELTPPEHEDTIKVALDADVKSALSSSEPVLERVQTFFLATPQSEDYDDYPFMSPDEALHAVKSAHYEDLIIAELPANDFNVIDKHRSSPGPRKASSLADQITRPSSSYSHFEEELRTSKVHQRMALLLKDSGYYSNRLSFMPVHSLADTNISVLSLPISASQLYNGTRYPSTAGLPATDARLMKEQPNLLAHAAPSRRSRSSAAKLRTSTWSFWERSCWSSPFWCWLVQARTQEQEKRSTQNDIFGIPLEASIKTASAKMTLYDKAGQVLLEDQIPTVLARAGSFIIENRTTSQHIFLYPAQPPVLTTLISQFSTGPSYGHSINLTPPTHGPCDAATLLAHYLLSLPEPVIPSTLAARFHAPLAAHSIVEVVCVVNPTPPDALAGPHAYSISVFDARLDIKAALAAYRVLIEEELAPPRRALLVYLLCWMASVVFRTGSVLSSEYVAAVFQPDVLGAGPRDDGGGDADRLPREDRPNSEKRVDSVQRGRTVLIFLMEYWVREFYPVGRIEFNE